MPERFYIPVRLETGSDVALDGGEAHHLAHVLRLGPGDEVVLFDGEGTEAEARIERVTKRETTLRVLRARTTEPPEPPRLILAAAVPKGDRFRWLVEKATELGVDRLIPLSTERSVVDPRESKLDRLRQTVVAACKQCGRNRLMEVAATTTFDECIAQLASAAAVALADPSGEPLREWLARVDASQPIVALIGPEGGFTDAERDLARQAGAAAVSLGPRILRIETAAIAMAALCGEGRAGGAHSSL